MQGSEVVRQRRFLVEILSITCLSWQRIVKDSQWGINVAQVNWLTYLETKPLAHLKICLFGWFKAVCVFPFILEGQSLLSVTVAYICLSVWICDFSLYYLTSWKHINNSAVKLLILLMFVLLFRFQKWSLLGGSSCHKKTCFCYLKGFHKRLKVVLMKMYELSPNQSNIPNILVWTKINRKKHL